MSHAPTATSDTVVSPSVPDKLMEQQPEIYHQLQYNPLKSEKRNLEEHADEETLARNDSFRCRPQNQAVPPTVWAAGEKKKKKKLRRGMRFPGDEEDETPLKQVGRGMLTIVTTPIALAGVGIYAVGLMVQGTGTILKGIGSMGRHVFVSPHPKRRDAPTTSYGA